jgi:pSer/pThr/pTyr-binding forkhead associated (FHA) protein
MPNLICVRGADQGKEWELPTIDVDMGRSPGNHVVVHDPKASRQHCKLIMGEGKVTLQDLKSRNGTKVEGNPIDEVELHYDQIFQIGDSLFIISPKSLSARAAEILNISEEKVGINKKSAYRVLFDELIRPRSGDLSRSQLSGSLSKYMEELRGSPEQELAERMAAAPPRPKLSVRDLATTPRKPPKS